MPNSEFMRIDPEKLAYWYFRLNGFLTIVNFVVHPDVGRRQRTDADILGVRFPYRAELLENPMFDDEVLIQTANKPLVVLAEVKTSRCRLNGPWTDPQRENMQRVLHAVGVFSPDIIEQVAQSLYSSGVWEDENYLMTLVCLGAEESTQVKQDYPQVPQILWNHVLEFIFERFTFYRRQKSEHPQWDAEGHRLYRLACRARNKQEFIESVDVVVGTAPRP